MIHRLLASVATISVLSLTLACGDEFEEATGAAGSGANSTGPGATTSSGAGAGGSGGASTSSSTGVGAGGGGGAPPAGCRAGTNDSQNLSLYSSLNNPMSVASPTPGDGAGFSIQPNTPSAFVPALSADGLQLVNHGDHLSYRQQVGGTVNFNPRMGSVDFCYMPFYDVMDDLDHFIMSWHSGDGVVTTIRKAGMANGNELHINLGDSDSFFQLIVYPQQIPLQKNSWHRLTVSWVLEGSNGDDVQIWVDGQSLPVAPALDGSISMPSPAQDRSFFIGAHETNAASLDGIVDELHVYTVPITPSN